MKYTPVCKAWHVTTICQGNAYFYLLLLSMELWLIFLVIGLLSEQTDSFSFEYIHTIVF